MFLEIRAAKSLLCIVTEGVRVIGLSSNED